MKAVVRVLTMLGLLGVTLYLLAYGVNLILAGEADWTTYGGLALGLMFLNAVVQAVVGD